MKTLRLFFIFLLFVVVEKSFAQLGEGGIPPSFYIQGLGNEIATAEMPIVNVDSLTSRDDAEKNEIKPFRFGYAIDVDLDLNNSGTWEFFENGDKLWRLKIFSEGAFSINLIFDNFLLLEGSQFFIYNEDKSMILGAFTARLNNNEYNMFATDLIQGSSIVLEYYEPAYSERGIIKIDKVIHAYKDMFGGRGLGDSEKCNIDVMCPLGDDWCVEMRAISLILVENNTALCSGCLINNVRQDLTPYYLTAEHCFYKKDGTLKTNPATCVFRFKYWRPTCKGSNPQNVVSINGASILAHNYYTDFALLKLSYNRLPAGFGFVFAGWDRTSTPAQNATTIHHPSADAMKISYADNPVVPKGWPVYFNGHISHWRATFDQGVVEHCSSGSPLFNQSHRVVGQLHGNYDYVENKPYCEQPIGDYGCFHTSWYYGKTSEERLKEWLDPDNTDIMSINATTPTNFLVNKKLCETHRYEAVNNMHIEGNVTNLYFSPSINCSYEDVIPFSTEPESHVTFKAKSIIIKSGTTFKTGSNVSLIATNERPDCNYFTDGDLACVYPSFVNNKTNGNNNDNKDFIKIYENNFSNRNVNSFVVNDKFVNRIFTLFPNPNPGTFQLETNFPLSDIVNLKITNSLGATVYETQTLFLNTIQLPTSVSGLHFVVAMLKTGTVLTQKMMVQR